MEEDTERDVHSRMGGKEEETKLRFRRMIIGLFCIFLVLRGVDHRQSPCSPQSLALSLSPPFQVYPANVTKHI